MSDPLFLPPASFFAKKLSRRSATALWVSVWVFAGTPGAWARTRRRSPSAQARRYPLSAGQYYWMPQVSPQGPVVAVVNIHTQMVQVYRNGVAIGFSSVSTGKSSTPTPTGLYPVLEKQRFHRSSTYDNAPMPYMMRLTWPGVALHGGGLPGYPASHGCIRLPHSFAPRIFSVFSRGDLVWVVNNALRTGASPLTTLAPITPDGSSLLNHEAFTLPQYWHPSWSAEAAPSNQPVSVLVSLSQHRLYVLQQGMLVAALELPPSVMETALEGGAVYGWKPASASAPGGWEAVDGNAQSLGPAWTELILPATSSFAQRLQPRLAAGSLLFVSHLAAVNDVHFDVRS